MESKVDVYSGFGADGGFIIAEFTVRKMMF